MHQNNSINLELLSDNTKTGWDSSILRSTTAPDNSTMRMGTVEEDINSERIHEALTDEEMQCIYDINGVTQENFSVKTLNIPECLL
jgi:hypothetical protein